MISASGLFKPTPVSAHENIKRGSGTMDTRLQQSLLRGGESSANMPQATATATGQKPISAPPIIPNRPGPGPMLSPEQSFQYFRIYSPPLPGAEGTKLTEFFGDDDGGILNEVFWVPRSTNPADKLNKKQADLYNKLMQFYTKAYRTSPSFKAMVGVYREWLRAGKVPKISIIIPRDSEHGKEVFSKAHQTRDGKPASPPAIPGEVHSLTNALFLYPEPIAPMPKDVPLGGGPPMFDPLTKKAQAGGGSLDSILMHEVIHALTKRSDITGLREEDEQLLDVMHGQRKSVNIPAKPVEPSMLKRPRFNPDFRQVPGSELYIVPETFMGQDVPVENTIMSEINGGKQNYHPLLAYGGRQGIFYTKNADGSFTPVTDQKKILDGLNKMIAQDMKTDGTLDWPYQKFGENQKKQQHYDLRNYSDFLSHIIAFTPQYLAEKFPPTYKQAALSWEQLGKS